MTPLPTVYLSAVGCVWIRSTPGQLSYYLYTRQGDYTPIAWGCQGEAPRLAENF